ncbi:MAG TPA: DUF222 domain-containing protein [Actinomycetota bacterium]|nr:DUF222 domain-containing protein [Actinomycetota bacterium]
MLRPDLEQFAYVPLGGFAVGSKDPSVEPWCAYDVVDTKSDRSSLAEQIEKGLNTSHHMRSRWHLTEMSYIVEATRNKLYEDYGYESASEWVASFLGVGYNKACETVDIAVMLEELVHLRVAYGNGSISYDHLRALVRVATTENELELLEMVKGKSVADTFRMVKRWVVLAEPDQEVKQGFLEMRWDKDNGFLDIYGSLPYEQGAMFKQAVDAYAKTLPDVPDEYGDPTPIATKRANALCEMTTSSAGGTGAKPLVMVHVDARHLVEASESCDTSTGLPQGQAPQIAGGCLIPPSVARRLLNDSIVQLVIDDPNGAPLAYGRRRRFPNARLKQGLENRDVTCRWPCCTRRVNLEAHHIVPWTEGGPTDYDNLVLLCHTHHMAIEHSGYKIRGKPPNIQIECPNGRLIMNGPPKPTRCIDETFAEERSKAIGESRPYGGARIEWAD